MHQTTALHESGFDGEKKDDRKILKQYLEKIMGYMEENKYSRKRFLVLPYRKNEFVLDEEEIEYIERDKRITKIHTLTGIVLTTMKMSEVEAYLDKERFVMCHNSFIVNMEKIRIFGRAEITLRSGDKVPISRSHWKQTRDIFERWTEENMKKGGV
ncbi:LytR/AlgR family response regulator transcription factor [Claveliimonas bilis]|uniref:LytR/AlgR family response regulator transcription factor n=1 Tax=Claveliimonas bilis TaxID=3028070 RepID=UPI00292F0FB4|nr:LytTR family DNA-binding domain-containing protein [Claveliimonas bilis]BDZ80216.1 hypothetical protein Lac3_14250 [Claveliimonas bilis]